MKNCYKINNFAQKTDRILTIEKCGWCIRLAERKNGRQDE